MYVCRIECYAICRKWNCAPYVTCSLMEIILHRYNSSSFIYSIKNTQSIKIQYEWNFIELLMWMFRKWVVRWNINRGCQRRCRSYMFIRICIGLWLHRDVHTIIYLLAFLSVRVCFCLLISTPFFTKSSIDFVKCKWCSKIRRWWLQLKRKIELIVLHMRF